MAEVSGKFRYQATFSSEYPAVGDFVLVNWNESGNSAIIESLLPRKSAFIRKAAGEPQQEQIVAANIDTIFLCMALNNDFNHQKVRTISFHCMGQLRYACCGADKIGSV